jgi:hypothetical protein
LRILLWSIGLVAMVLAKRFFLGFANRVLPLWMDATGPQSQRGPALSLSSA